MLVRLSIGEAVDKLSILEIKTERISDPIKSRNIMKEHSYLMQALYDELGIDIRDHLQYSRLRSVNQQLWEVEDLIRSKDKKQEFDQEFIDIAKSVYRLNEHRSEAKKELDIEFNSKFTEEKQYAPFK